MNFYVRITSVDGCNSLLKLKFQEVWVLFPSQEEYLYDKDIAISYYFFFDYRDRVHLNLEYRTVLLKVE